MRPHRIAAVADEQQVALIKQGTNAWNEWRELRSSTKVNLTSADLTRANLAGAFLRDADLAGADLRNADLAGANLGNADLTSAHLTGAILTGAHLVLAHLPKADLTGARLIRTHLIGADLRHANLTSADLFGANLTGAGLAGAVLTDAHCFETVLADVDLSQALGLEFIFHGGPSAVDHRTLERSGPLPLSFLRGCGLPDRLIDYLPSLLNAAPIEFHSVFISYSTANQDFAERLHADLQARGVRCWFAPHDMQGGKRLHDQIDEAIRIHDRLLLILSRESMSSRWVTTEIEKAREKEVRLKRDVLFPVALVPFSDIRDWQQFNPDLGEDTARRVRDYFVPDFRAWDTNHGRYLESFEKLLASLKNADTRTGSQGTAGKTEGRANLRD